MWILAVAIAVVSSPVAVDTPMQITACVSVDKGTLYRVKEGTQPSEPCTAGDRTITWSIAGPPGPQGPAAPAPPRFPFGGVTSAHVTGAGSSLAMSRACAAQYTGGRMASTVEFRETINPPTFSEDAWILASPNIYSNPDFIDASGFVFQLAAGTKDYDCSGWRNAPDPNTGTASRGTIITTGGALSAESCATSRPVACSAPE